MQVYDVISLYQKISEFFALALKVEMQMARNSIHLTVLNYKFYQICYNFLHCVHWTEFLGDPDLENKLISIQGNHNEDNF